MTERLPTPGGDTGTWDTILNGWASVEHNADGTHSGRGRTWESFGGLSGAGGTIAVQAAAMVLAQAWWTANAGGTIYFGPFSYNNMPQIILPVTGSGICGDGMQSTTLTAKASLNADFIINHVSTGSGDPNAQMCRVQNMQIDGNKASNSSGGGINFTCNPTLTQQTGDYTFDAMHLIENIWMTNVKGTGITTAGRSATYISHCDIKGVDGIGITVGFDTWLHALNVGLSGLQGCKIEAPNVFATGCAMYYSGNVLPSSGAGWLFQNFNNNGSRITACGSQDNKAYGWQLANVSLIQLSSCVADSNSTTSSGTYSGVDMFGASHCTIDVACQDRKWDGIHNTQLTALQIRSTSINNRIRLAHYSSASTINAPIQTWDANCTGNEVNIEGYGGQQFPTFAASFTPNPTLGGTIILGAMTANLTINAVAAGNLWPGQVVTFHLTQDGTGGRTYTFNAQYVLAGASSASLVTTASKRNIISFIYDATATKFYEIGRIVNL